MQKQSAIICDVSFPVPDTRDLRDGDKGAALKIRVHGTGPVPESQALLYLAHRKLLSNEKI